MFSSLRRAFVGLIVIAASTVAVPVSSSVVTASDGTIDNTGWSPETGGLAQISGAFTENGNPETFVATASAVTSTGGLLVTGYVGDIDQYQTHMALVRVTSSGELDTSFGGNGLIVYDRGLDGSNNQIYGYADAIFPTSGGFLVGGWVGGGWMNGKSALMKVSEAGVIDASWGSSGSVIASEAPARWNYGAGNYWVDGTSILMLSNDTANSQVWVHRFAESTGAPVAIGTGANNYATFSNTDFGGRSPEPSIALSGGFRFIFISQGGAGSTALIYRFDTSWPSPVLDTNFGTNGVLATSIPDGVLKPLVRMSNGRLWMVGSTGSTSSDSTVFTRLEGDGTINSSYGTSGYVTVSNFHLALGTVANDNSNDLLLVGRLNNSDALMRFVGGSGAPDANFQNGVNPPGVVTTSATCNLGTYGWIVPISGTNRFFQVSGQSWFDGAQFVSGFRALKWTQSGLAATACTGEPPTGTLTYSSSNFPGTTGSPMSISAPTTANFLSAPTFAVSQFGSALPTGLTLDTTTGAISGTPSADSSAFVTIEATVSLAGGRTQRGTANISFNITSPQQNDPSPNPNQPPACATGALTVTGSSPALDTSWATNGWLSTSTQGSYLNTYGFVPTSDGHYLLISSSQGNSNTALDLRKFDATGAPVASYGTNGILLIEDANLDLQTNRAVVGPSGDIYVNVYDYSSSVDPYMVKLDSTGNLDSNFGTGGILDLTSIPGESVSDFSVGSNDTLFVSSSTYGATPANYLSKFDASGIVAGFGTNGSVVVTSSGGRSPLALADGSVLIGGSTSGQLNIAKYTSSGSLDTSWATSGLSTFGNSSLSESMRRLTLDGTSIIVTYSLMMMPQPGQNGPPPSQTGVARVDLNGAVDTTFGVDGGVLTPSRVLYSYPWSTVVLSDGSILLHLMKYTANDENSTGFVRFSSSGELDAAFASDDTYVEHGTCGVFPAGVIDLGSGAILAAGSKYLGSGGGSATESVIGKFTVSAVTAGANGGGFSGSSPSPSPTTPPADDDDDAPAPRVPGRPNLVNDDNQPNLVREPGRGGAIVNGEDRPATTEWVNVPAAQVRPERRTQAQVNQIRQAANQLVQQFTQQLPAGTRSPVVVVDTNTGAIIRGLVTDANGNPVDVPAEDVVIITAEQMVVMVGSQNANVTPDGRFQVPVGSTFGLAGTGFGSEEAGEFIVMSTPTLITEFETTDVGTFDKSGTLPETIGIGDHTLVVATGTTYAVLGIQVVPTTLPVTGSSSDTVLVFALFTLVFGALLIRSRRTLLA